ncbi:2''-5'' RNA ligase [Calderihabitans maritimus]|uniref:RNA 2',3'-cyclic phosphodiesterase n=1 Tax=Calderihabitans maritimus TaxID=1246530 RepID=A0A1Z5HQI6_9FIRM|nr:2''-5'' RNA ligase [Calderihabitans maritimus]
MEENNFHLTLYFLGEVDQEEIPAIQQLLQATTREVPPFTVEFDTLGTFPPRGVPRVVWIGLKESTPLQELYRSLLGRLKILGYKEEKKPFFPHVTLGRVRSPRNTGHLVKLLKTVRGSIPAEEVREIFLMESTLTPKGPIYEVVSRFSLKKSSG